MHKKLFLQMLFYVTAVGAMMLWLQQLRHWLSFLHVSSPSNGPVCWPVQHSSFQGLGPYVDFIKLLGLSKQEGSMHRDRLGCLEESVFLQGASPQNCPKVSTNSLLWMRKLCERCTVRPRCRMNIRCKSTRDKTPFHVSCTLSCTYCLLGLNLLQ